MSPRVAITGGCGFVGSALARQFSNKFDVRILDTKTPQVKAGENVEYVQCDVRNYGEVEEGLKGVDLAIHTAIIQIPQINESKRLGFEVNVRGTQNVCEAVRGSTSVKGLILTGSWHTIGETRITGVVDERFGLRPDMVEDRARLYALSKMAQEAIVRIYDEESRDKTYGIIRIGTGLGEAMPEKTAANIFLNKALKGEPITVFDHSMYRPMLYVDVRNDVCGAFESYALKLLQAKMPKTGSSLGRIVNVYYPEPTTVLELAQIVKESVTKFSDGRIRPEIAVVKTGQRSLFAPEDKMMMKIDVAKARDLLGLDRMVSPRESIDRIVKTRMRNAGIRA